jgi:hypothetical protein
VTNAEVKQILDTDVTDLDPFITVANSYVTDELATPARITDTTRLKEIERWLAAHFFKCSLELQEKVHEVGETKATFYGASNLSGFNATLYGQQAITLDTTGTLADAGKRKGSFKPILAISRAEETT